MIIMGTVHTEARALEELEIKVSWIVTAAVVVVTITCSLTNVKIIANTAIGQEIMR
jgi:hypothetical protein